MGQIDQSISVLQLRSGANWSINICVTAREWGKISNQYLWYSYGVSGSNWSINICVKATEWGKVINGYMCYSYGVGQIDQSISVLQLWSGSNWSPEHHLSWRTGLLLYPAHHWPQDRIIQTWILNSLMEPDLLKSGSKIFRFGSGPWLKTKPGQ